MLELARQHKFQFDACQMPVNAMDAHFRSFTNLVLPKLVAEGIAVLAMKPMGDGHLLRSGTVTAQECLRYALSQQVSVVITGCESMERLDQALNVVRGFKPMDRSEMASVLAKTHDAALTGRYEPFKTTAMFDGTARNPNWMS